MSKVFKPCYCSICSRAPAGFILQEQRNIRLHQQRDEERAKQQHEHESQEHRGREHDFEKENRVPSVLGVQRREEPIILGPSEVSSSIWQGADPEVVTSTPFQDDVPSLSAAILENSDGWSDFLSSDDPPFPHFDVLSSFDASSSSDVPLPHSSDSLPPSNSITDATHSASDAPSTSISETLPVPNPQPDLFPAFTNETPPIRLAYLHAVYANVYSGSTVLHATNQLNNEFDTIEACLGTLPEYPKPARTLQTAKSRLGILADDGITNIPICTACFRPYTLQEINALDSPGCTEPRCKGIAYRMKRASNNLERRVPAKIQPYASFIMTLQRFMLREDFVKNLRTRLPSSDPARHDSDSMTDISHGTHWRTRYLGLKRIIGEDGSVQDVEVSPGSKQLLSECPYGLSWTWNMDWFGITDNRPHSAGGIYGICNDLHWSVRFLPQNVYMTPIPGPTEPSLEQLNHILKPLRMDLEELYRGRVMAVYAQRIPPQVHVMNHAHCSDIPASRKTGGAAGHSHKTHPCNFCFTTLEQFNERVGYEPNKFRHRDDYDQLRYAFESYRARTKAERKRILDEHGCRHSDFNWLPGWLPVSCSILDFMHAFYGIVSAFWTDTIVGGYLFDAAMWRRFESIINDDMPIWPSGIGKLPDNLGTNHSLQKADQWRRLCNIQPTLLWLVWREQGTNNIRRNAPSVPSNAKSAPTFTRDLPKIYQMALYLSSAERLMAAQSITMVDIKRASGYLQSFCLMALELGIHLTANHHLSMHFEDIFSRFSTVYGWWLFPFERFNGYLEDVNLNGHANGEMELTLLRNWIERQRLYELIVNLPPNATPQERKIINQMSVSNNGGRGTFGLHVADAASMSDTIRTGRKRKHFTDLRGLNHDNIYALLLGYAQQLWPELHLTNDFDLTPGRTNLMAARCARILQAVHVRGIRFGAETATRTTADQFAIARLGGAIVPCQIIYHFELQIDGKEPAVCSVVKALQSDDRIPPLPMDRFAPDLGIYTTYVQSDSALQVIPSTALMGSAGVVSFTCCGITERLYMIHSFDRSGIDCSAEDFLEEDD